MIFGSFGFHIVINRYKCQVTQRIELCSPPSVPEKGLDNPQVQGIATVFEGRVFNPNLLIRHKGSQRIFSSISSRVVNSTTPERLNICNKVFSSEVVWK